MKFTDASTNINVSLFNIGINTFKQTLTVEIKIPKDKWNISNNQFDADGNKLKNNPFITKIGLLNEKNELVAVAKISKPIRKDSDRDICLTFNMEL